MPSSRVEGKSFGMELKAACPRPHIYDARVDMIYILLFHQNYDLAYQDFFSIELS